MVVAISSIKIIPILVDERDRFCLTVKLSVVEMSDGLKGKCVRLGCTELNTGVAL